MKARGLFAVALAPVLASGGCRAPETAESQEVAILRQENHRLRDQLVIAQGRPRRVEPQNEAQELQRIIVAVQAYQRDHGGNLPSSPQDLEGRYLEPDLLRGSDGQPYWLDLASMGDFQSHQIVGYDRAAYARREYVPTLFGDGHTELLAPLRFRDLTTQPPNNGVDFDLPEMQG